MTATDNYYTFGIALVYAAGAVPFGFSTFTVFNERKIDNE